MKWFVLGIKGVSAMEEITQKRWPHRNQRIAVKCIDKFHRLNHTVENLNPYFSFIQCARVALGMQGKGDRFSAYGQSADDYILQDFRKHGLNLVSQGLSLKIFPRFNGFALDKFMKDQATPNVVLYHGVKKDEDILKNENTQLLTKKNKSHSLQSLSLDVSFPKLALLGTDISHLERANDSMRYSLAGPVEYVIIQNIYILLREIHMLSE